MVFLWYKGREFDLFYFWESHNFVKKETPNFSTIQFGTRKTISRNYPSLSYIDNIILGIGITIF